MLPVAAGEGSVTAWSSILADVIPEIEDLTGATLKRILADAGYRGHNAPGIYKLRVLAAAGYNFRLILKWIRLLLALFWISTSGNYQERSAQITA